MDIRIKTIPHRKQRLHNGDIADWYYGKKGELIIKVSDFKNDEYALLVALHELVETALCKKHGISVAMVDEWDCSHPEMKGDDKNSPYHREHKFSTKIERLMAKELGIDWRQYDKFIENFDGAK